MPLWLDVMKAAIVKIFFAGLPWFGCDVTFGCVPCVQGE